MNNNSTGKRYYHYSNSSTISDNLFTGVFYNPTKCYVNWPGQSTGTDEHQETNPLYCVADWKNNTSSVKKPEKFYTLCTTKECYHKLFNPANQSKIFFQPSDQFRDVKLDSSVLFFRRTYKRPLRYKYSFLTDIFI